MDLDDAGRGIRFLIRDRVTKYTSACDAVIAGAAAVVIRIPVRAPRANAVCERFVGTVRREVLDRLLILNAAHARTVLGEYETHVNTHRPHRALGRATPLRCRSQPWLRTTRRGSSGAIVSAVCSTNTPRSQSRVTVDNQSVSDYNCGLWRRCHCLR